MSLLTPQESNPKTAHVVKGWRSAILHLQPTVKLCPWSSPGCRQGCLNTAGRGQMSCVQKARHNKTQYFLHDKNAFVYELENEIAALVRRCEREGVRPALRLNGTSDVRWENHVIMQHFPMVQFYDYTKDQPRMRAYMEGKLPKNLHLTFSVSERLGAGAFAGEVLRGGGTVAVVFDKIPKKWNGFRVVDGTTHDLIFLRPKGCIIGLIAKGKAKQDRTGFVVRTNQKEA